MSVYQCPSVVENILGVILFVVTVAFMPAVCGAETAREYHVIIISQREVKARLHVEAETAVVPKEWFLAAPHPPELDRQIKITARLSPSGKPARELSSQRRPILVARVRDASQRLNVDVDYSMTLVARSLVLRQAGEPVTEIPALSNSQRAPWLANSPMCAYREREFQNWLDDAELRKSADESVVDFGRRAFEYLRAEFSYEFLSELDRRVTRVCREKKSDCLGLCVVYVSIMRANEIPARILVGRWAQSSVAGDTLGEVEYNKEHVKCEFHAPDVGWIPVDPATALMQEREHVSKRQFGLDTADFITMHVNDQLVIQPGSGTRRTIPFLQGVYYSVLSESKSSDIKLRLQWQVETLSKSSERQ